MYVQTVADVPAPHRYAAWWGAVAESVVGVQVTSGYADDFWADMKWVDLGRLRVSRVRTSSFDVSRTRPLIRRSDPELYQLSLSLRGRSGLEQLRREASVGPGDFVLYDTSREFRAFTRAGQGRPGRLPSLCEGIVLQVPRDLLPLRTAHVDRVLCTAVSGRDDISGVLATVLTKVTERSDTPTALEATHLSSAVIELLVGMLAERLALDAVGDAAKTEDSMLPRVQTFIDQHLTDPDLSPAVAAGAHHVSLSYLQKLFHRHDTTVAGWIRQRRLERCRQDLADPALAHLPVHAIAARWCFCAESHFNRLFRETYGMPPAAWRRSQIVGAAPGTG